MRCASCVLVLVLLGACGPSSHTGELPSPTGVTAEALSASQIRVRWTAPAVVALLAYRVLRDGAEVQSANATEVTDEGLEAGRRYCYAIVAVDEAGHSSAPSDQACATTPDGWTLRAGGTSMLLTAVAAKGGRVIALGDEQKVMVSDDDGQSWSVHAGSGLGSSAYYATEPPWTDLMAYAGLFVATSGVWHTVYTSTDGLSWTQRLASTNDLKALAASPSHIVAVGSGGVVDWSADGLTWGAATSGTTADLVGVTWTGTYFVAVAQNGQLLHSFTGTSWTPDTSPLTSGSCIASSGTRTVAIGDRVAWSTDGIHWTAAVAPTIWIRGCAWSASSARFVVATDDGVYTSPDGVTWTAATGDAYAQLKDVADTGTAVVVVGDSAQVLRSPDGSTYATAFTGTTLYGVEWLGDRFAAVGNDGMILFSTDGLAWTHSSSGNSGDVLLNATYGGGKWVVGGQAVILSSSDGSAWTPSYIGTLTQAHGVAWTGTSFLAAQTNGIWRSQDGTAWSQVYGVYGDQALGLAVDGPRLVAVGSQGLVLTSADELTWTKGTTGTSASLEAVAWSGSRFVAVGTGGTIIGSADGLAWSKATSGVTAGLHDVTWTGTDFVASGEGNTVLTSADGLAWTRAPTTDSTTRALNGVAVHAGRIVAVSWDGGIYTLH